MADTQTISCKRCGNKNVVALASTPFNNPLGERIKAEICQDCWKSWLAQQQRLINHYGLSTMDAEHRQILMQNLKAYLFNEGELAQIDTSLEGSITHIQR
jgi:Fe-S cluster biosynthesis and repair protein YggX